MVKLRTVVFVKSTPAKFKRDCFLNVNYQSDICKCSLPEDNKNDSCKCQVFALSDYAV